MGVDRLEHLCYYWVDVCITVSEKLRANTSPCPPARGNRRYPEEIQDWCGTPGKGKMEAPVSNYVS